MSRAEDTGLVEAFLAAIGKKAAVTSDNLNVALFQIGYLESFIANRLESNPNLRSDIIARTTALQNDFKEPEAQ